MGDRAYVVAAEMTNPLYTLDMSDPTNPQAVGEFAIAGYTNFVQPIGDDIVVGVGMGGNENGTTLGFEISVFNVSDIRKPVRVQSLDVSRKENATFSSYSEAQYNSKAWRYLPDSKLLIVPVTEREYTLAPCTEPGALGDCYPNTGGYDGFRVFKIDPATGVVPTLTIKHVLGDKFISGCYTAFWMQPRSLVFGGDVMTIKGHSILSHDLTTLAEEANIMLDTDVEDCSAWTL
jgi:Beta propeller domain